MLGRLADEVGITRIRALDDLIPLLFAHSNYKSYPEGFIAKGRWDLMNKWLDTLSSVRVDDVDVEGVTDQDEWIDRLHAAGHKVYVTSGTSGKNSFLPADAVRRGSLAADADPDRSPGCQRALRRRQRPADLHLRPEVRPPPGRAALPRRSSRRSGAPTPATSSPRSRCGSRRSPGWRDLRKRIAEGTAMPSEIAAFEREAPARQEATWPSGSTS